MTPRIMKISSFDSEFYFRTPLLLPYPDLLQEKYSQEKMKDFFLFQARNIFFKSQ